MSDRLTGVLFLALAVWYGITAGSFEQGFGDPVGPAAFPQLLSLPLGVFALYLVLRPDPAPDWPRAGTLVRQGVMLVVLLGYPLVLEPLGFPLATAIALMLMSMQLGARPVPAIAGGLGLAIGLFVMFDTLLGLHLPMLPEAFSAR